MIKGEYTTEKDAFDRDVKKLSGLTASQLKLNEGNLVINEKGEAEEATGDDVKFTFTGEYTTCELSTDIVNQSGSLLPSTGGIGTTIFYVVGGILVLGAGLLLVTKRRMKSN